MAILIVLVLVCKYFNVSLFYLKQIFFYNLYIQPSYLPLEFIFILVLQNLSSALFSIQEIVYLFILSKRVFKFYFICFLLLLIQYLIYSHLKFFRFSSVFIYFISIISNAFKCVLR